jgi:hypothetical protein
MPTESSPGELQSISLGPIRLLHTNSRSRPSCDETLTRTWYGVDCGTEPDDHFVMELIKAACCGFAPRITAAETLRSTTLKPESVGSGEYVVDWLCQTVTGLTATWNGDCPDCSWEFIEYETCHSPLRRPYSLRTSEEARSTTNKSYTEPSSNEANGAERSYRITQGRLPRLCAPSTQIKTNQRVRIRLSPRVGKHAGRNRTESVRWGSNVTVNPRGCSKEPPRTRRTMKGMPRAGLEPARYCYPRTLISWYELSSVSFQLATSALPQ